MLATTSPCSARNSIIVGITNYTSVINRNAVIAGLPDLQEATFRTGSVTFIAVRLANPADSGEPIALPRRSRAWASSL